MAQKKWFAPIEEKTHDIGELDLPKKCLLLDDDEEFVQVITDFLQSQNW